MTFSLSMHGVTEVASIDINNTSDVLKSGWVTLQVAVKSDTFNKNSKETWQSITLFFEDLEVGVDSFMDQLEDAYQKWQQDNTVLRKKIVNYEEELSDEIKEVHERHMDRS